jgi:hypothetical protein
MRKAYSKKYKVQVATPENTKESLEALFEFLSADLWYESHQWKTKKQMLKYLKAHFKICLDEITSYRYGKKCKSHK